jgi:hypothetical protein
MNLSVYLIGWRFVVTQIPTDEVDIILDQLGSWIRYNGFTWFLCTSLSADQIYERLKGVIQTDDSILIIGVDASKRFGWAPQWVWDWVDAASKVATQKNVNPPLNPPTGGSSNLLGWGQR